MLICWNDIKIHLGFEDSYFVPPPTKSALYANTRFAIRYLKVFDIEYHEIFDVKYRELFDPAISLCALCTRFFYVYNLSDWFHKERSHLKHCGPTQVTPPIWMSTLVRNAS